MIAWDKVLSELIGIVGWRQSTIAGSAVVDTANLVSSSGLYVQGAHPSVTVANIKATQEDKLITDGAMNTVLSNLVKDGTSNVLNELFPSRDVLANDLLYVYESDFQTPLTELKGFVGFEISIAERKDIVSVLNKIILQFSGSGSIKLLLFNTGVITPITSKVIAVTADTNIISALDWILGYITAPGGRYYLGYLNNNLMINAYDRRFSRSNIMTQFNSIVFKSIYVPNWSAETLFDINDIVYRAESFGINLDVTTAKDYSNVILQNKDRFAKAIQLATAVQALSLMTSTSRINPEERVIMNVLGQKVVVDSPASYNLYSSLQKEMKSLADLFTDNRNEIYTMR